MRICRIIVLTGAYDNQNDSFSFVLSFSSFCALHRFRRARPALSCSLPLFVPFPMPSSLWAPILCAVGGIGWRGGRGEGGLQKSKHSDEGEGEADAKEKAVVDFFEGNPDGVHSAHRCRTARICAHEAFDL